MTLAHHDAIDAATPADSGVYLLGQRLDPITEIQTIHHIMDALAAGQGGWIVTANLDHLRRLVHDPAYRELCRPASLVVADGMPLLWAARIQGTPLPGRVAGSDLVHSLSAAAAEQSRSIFLLGGSPGTADRAADVLRSTYPGTRIAGTYCPPLGFEHDPNEIDAIGNQLAAAKPDIIYVALGSPKQEQLIHQFREHLPEVWWIGVGISFSFLCGDVRRAPKWLQKLGLEWTHRLVQEPRRLARRYLVDGLPFAVTLLASSAWKRVTRANRR